MTLEVIGAGFGRTGTLSLKLALECLGFGPCCHGTDDRHLVQNKAFWQRAFNNKAVDWDEYFLGYRSTVDSPSCRFYLELSEKYPSAKLILTLRDPIAWYESYRQTILPMSASAQGRMFLSFLFGSAFPDRSSMISAYEKHNEEVQRSISPNRLLVYDVKDGWPPLCHFLRVTAPDSDFPRSNSREEFQSTIEDMLERLSGDQTN